MILHLWEKNQESHLFLWPLKPRLKKTQAQLGFQGMDHEVFTQLNKTCLSLNVQKDKTQITDGSNNFSIESS